jgi:hypothetical protein
MLKTSHQWLVAAFLIGFFAVGLGYWPIPYSQVSLPSSLYDIGLIVVGGAAALTRAISDARFWPTVFVTGAAVPGAVCARVIFDTWRDPTSHNLWPFEILIALVVGFAVTLIGAPLGSLFRRLFRGTETRRYV